MQKRLPRFLVGLVLFLGLTIVVYNLPPVHERLVWRVDNLRTQIIYFFNPPDQAIFQPTEQAMIATIVSATMQAYHATPTPTVTPAPPDLPTATPTITPTSLPASVSLPGVIYVDQHERWNYCGPANLTMALNFWGWKGNRDDVAKVIKPGENDPKKDFIQRGFKDKNVMPYEMVDFVNEHTEFRALMRYGGDMALLKRLIAAGFPVMIEKGYYEVDYTGKLSWMGHYSFITGYNNAQQHFIYQEVYPPRGTSGRDWKIEYASLPGNWRTFNYLFMVVYPPDREVEVLALLADWADPQWANQHALQTANREVTELQGIDLFFAWFSKGTSHVQLLEYPDAAAAYDQAFAIYATLGQDDKQRPYRMMWYQTGPYWAYFYSGRYQDVIALADTTLNETIAEPTLEESLYWRGMAKYMIGDTQGAIDDYRAALAIHANWGPAVQALQDLGIQP